MALSRGSRLGPYEIVAPLYVRILSSLYLATGLK